MKKYNPPPAGFWDTLPRPILALAPMYDITDSAFRQMLVVGGKPDICFSEFVPVDGLCQPRSRDTIIRRYLRFTRSERPMVMQIFGTRPEYFRLAARLADELDFDGVDINMGCPDKKIMQNGAGAALIKTPELAREIIYAAQEGAGKLPISIKTRLGCERDTVEEWVAELLPARPAAITIHARTAEQMSKVPADWAAVGRAAQVAVGSDTLILGNGDIRNRTEAMAKAKKWNLVGVMVGRGVLGNYWFFNPNVKIADIPLSQKLNWLVRHAELFETENAGERSFNIFKKHISALVTGFTGAREFRPELLAAASAAQLRAKIEKYIRTYAEYGKNS